MYVSPEESRGRNRPVLFMVLAGNSFDGVIEMILFFGDLHGKFGHVERAVAEHRPEAIILLGDIEATRPLEVELAKVMEMTEMWFIPGNHDTDRPELLANLNESKLAHRNLHGRMVTIDGLRVAGLGGVFREEIWWPVPVDADSHYDSYADYQRHSEAGRGLAARISTKNRNEELSRQGQMSGAKAVGKLLKHCSSIFPSVYYDLAMQEADVLVTHEAPSCHPNGFVAIDELARSMRVQKSFHGHQHDNLDYQPKWDAMGFKAYGVGLRGIKDLNGIVMKAGELDAQRASRQERIE